MAEHRIMLTDEDFKQLVRGDIITKEVRNGDTVKFALQDIGWLRMLDLINEAANKKKNT